MSRSKDCLQACLEYSQCSELTIISELVTDHSSARCRNLPGLMRSVCWWRWHVGPHLQPSTVDLYADYRMKVACPLPWAPVGDRVRWQQRGHAALTNLKNKLADLSCWQATISAEIHICPFCDGFPPVCLLASGRSPFFPARVG
ncbi:hypothetical protein INR49_003225 [Caranx melampygus]|nr:hypothetical protein INR49_003225 [Caranx melampygus]